MKSAEIETSTPTSVGETEPKLNLHVAPQNGKQRRLVIAQVGERKYTDEINSNQAAARERFARKAAEKLGVRDPEFVKLIVDQLPDKAEEADRLAIHAAREAAERDEETGDVDPGSLILATTDPEVFEAAERFLGNPEMMEELSIDFQELGLAGETFLAWTLYMVGTSRKLEKPLGGCVKSTSASGKSYVTEIIVSLMPPEAVINATELTPNALYYLPPGSLIHKLVCVGERKHSNAGQEADNANATLPLREMMSRGRLDKYVTMRTDDGMATRHIVQEGPIAYLETTTMQHIFEEDETRLLPLATDESPAQTAAIMAIQAKRAAGRTTSVEAQEAIRQKHRAAQRMLKPLRVRIPFAEKLCLPDSKIIVRRAFPQLLACIASVALLRQKQKTVRKDGGISASAVDYRIAYELMTPVLGRTFAPLNQRALDLLRVIREQAPRSTTFTRSDCQNWAGVGLTEVRHRLESLVEAGYVEQESGNKGVQYKYRLLDAKDGHAPPIRGLITPDELEAALDAEKLARQAKKESTRAKVK